MTSTLAEQVLQKLESYELKAARDGQWQCNSPFRAGSNSHAFIVKIEGDDKGTFFDHVSGDKGSLKELAARLGILDESNRKTVATTKRSYTGLADYAKAHGLTPDQLAAWHWREVTYMNRPALEYATKTGNRWRFLDGLKDKPTYISPKGYERCWYGLDSRTKKLLADGHPLVICNGEISVVAGWANWLAAVCITSGEKAEIPQNLLAELKGEIGEIAQLKIVVAMDCDSAGIKAGRGIAQQLKSVGFNVRAVDLGLGYGGDLADFCMLHRDTAEVNLLQCPDLAAPALAEAPMYNWQFMTPEEMFKLPPTQWLIPRMLPARGFSTIYGPSGSGKSFVALDIGLRIAQDKPVVYVAAEGESGYTPRTQAWMKHHQKGYGKLTFVLGAVNMFDQEEFDYFQQRLATYSPALLVIDTFAMCMGDANENDTREMMLLIRAAKQLAFRLNCAVLFVHHTNKEGVRERGSGTLRNASDTMIRIIREDDDLLRVKSEKTKDSLPFKAYRLRHVQIDLGYTDSLGDPVSSLVLLPEEIVDAADELTEQQMSVLQALALESDASYADLAATTEINRNSIAGTIKRLKDRGYLLVDGKSRLLTDKAHQVLGDSTDSSDSSDSRVLPKAQLRESPESPESPESENHLVQGKMFDSTLENQLRA